MKEINRNAPAICSRTIAIQAPIEVVWNLITGINDWSQWQTDISRARLQGTLSAGSVFTWTTGGVSITSTIHNVEVYRGFGWTGKTFGAKAIHNWTISNDGSITTVAVEESMEGFLVSLFRKSFNQNLAKGMDKWLTLLKEQAENASLPA